MSLQFSRIFKIRIAMVGLTAVLIGLQVLMGVFMRTHLADSFNGVLMACQLMVCILMVRVSCKYGLIISMVWLVYYLVLVLTLVFGKKVIGAIPGVVNCFLYTVVLTFLAKLLSAKEREIHTDALTGLLNRKGLFRCIQDSIDFKRPFHIIYVDLGNFRLYNDNYGHSVGDDIMKTVANRMRKAVAKTGFAGRIGGDEFVIVTNERTNPQQLTCDILDSICDKITIEAQKESIDCYLNAAAGVAAFPYNAKDPESLIRCADIAMYEAAKKPSSRYVIFSSEMSTAMDRAVVVDRMIRDGLENNWFYMVYQPQFTAGNKKLRGFESLIRLKTPDETFVSPAEFIPVAEKNELILSVDDYVMHHVMADFTDIVTKNNPDLVIAINVSAKNFSLENFVDKVVDSMCQTGFPAKNLEIEITEYCLANSDVAISNIQRLRDMGVQVALDDFGTGYTSLNYLAKLPVNLLKVDKSLIDEIEHDEKSLSFVKSVISIGHLMGCEVISEGVETEGQLDLLKDDDCDFIQGYVWGKPLNYDVAVNLTKEI